MFHWWGRGLLCGPDICIVFVIWSCIRIKGEIKHHLTPHKQQFCHWPFQRVLSVAALLCLSVGGLICGVCFVIICFSSLFLFMLREGRASCLWHSLGIFYISDKLHDLWSVPRTTDISILKRHFVTLLIYNIHVPQIFSCVALISIHFRLNIHPTFILEEWMSNFSYARLCDLDIPRAIRLNYLQIVETLIRRRVLWRLIWACSVCQITLLGIPRLK